MRHVVCLTLQLQLTAQANARLYIARHCRHHSVYNQVTMDEQVFYVVLSSNASMDVNPGNKISNYKVRLAKPIRFAQGTEWEVGLKDISFTRSWYTLNFEQKIKYFNIGQSEHGVISKTVSEAYATLQPGYFTSPQSVINELAVTLRDNNWGGIIELNPLTKTVIVKPKVVTNITKTKEKKKYISHLSYPLFSEELLEFLGLYSAYDHFLLKN